VQPLLQWKNNNYYIFWLSFTLRYPACNANASFCRLWPAPLYNIFSHYLINGTICGKKVIEHKRFFLFSLQLLSETFLILRRTGRDMIKMCIGLHVKYPLLLSDFSETYFFSTDFRKIIWYQIAWKPVQWEPSCSLRTDEDGQTDRQTDMTKLLTILRTRLKMWN